MKDGETRHLGTFATPEQAEHPVLRETPWGGGEHSERVLGQWGHRQVRRVCCVSVQVIHESSRDPLKIRVVRVLFPCVSKIRARARADRCENIPRLVCVCPRFERSLNASCVS
jgi:hypothetical protein